MTTRRRLAVYGLRLGGMGAVVGLWLYGLGPGDVSPLLLPEFGDVGDELGAQLSTGAVYEAIRTTMTEIVISMLIAGSAGFAVGFWGARSEVRARTLEPLLVWAYLVPTILFYPVFIVWFGVGMQSKIVYATFNAFFVIAFNCIRAFRTVDLRYITVARAFGASKFQLDWLVKFRAGLPLAAAGLRLGAALTMVTTIGAEMLASDQGLGYLIRRASQSFLAARTYALIIVALLVVTVFHFVLRVLIPTNRGARARR